jgi:uncharacterized protein
VKGVSFETVRVTDRFWAPKIDRHRRTTVPLCIRRCRETGRIDNFAKAAGLLKGGFEGRHYNDSDVHKVLEGAAYTLMHGGDPELEAEADAIIDLIEAAQLEDGYIYNYYILTDPSERWTDMDAHEMYSMGHLFEAAVAYYRATGKDKLLRVAVKAADHIDREFGEGGRNWVPGHEEIELALVKLYHATGTDRYLRLAHRLLEQRGHGHGRGKIWDKPDWGPGYCQDDEPVTRIRKIKGHAVRAMYLFVGMADVAKECGISEYTAALDKVWEKITSRNMYLTGGIGSSAENEGFTEDYDLPNATAYCETCASVGMVLWNHRMNMLHGRAEYADIVETALYNGSLSGVSLDGTRFFYSNPLESDGSVHRSEWFGTSCCPTQIARFLPSVGGYVYAVDERIVFVNLYVRSTTTLSVGGTTVSVGQETDYPWDGKVTVTIECDTPPEGGLELRLRLPGWCREYRIEDTDGLRSRPPIENGYLVFRDIGRGNTTVDVAFGMPVYRNSAHEKVKADAGLVALSRGPLVYCFEECDNPDGADISISEEARFRLVEEDGELGRIVRIEVQDRGRIWSAVPYHLWDNRKSGWMKVWVPEMRTAAMPLYVRR